MKTFVSFASNNHVIITHNVGTKSLCASAFCKHASILRNSFHKVAMHLQNLSLHVRNMLAFAFQKCVIKNMGVMALSSPPGYPYVLMHTSVQWF